MLFTDTVTIYSKTTVEDQETWVRTVVHGVQWSDKTSKANVDGKISVARYISVTFPEGTYEGLNLNAANEEDAIVYGEVTDEVTGARGNRISDLLEKYPKSGRIESVNDNSRRDFLKNIKVVLG